MKQSLKTIATCHAQFILKSIFFFCCLLSGATAVLGQHTKAPDNIIITSRNEKTQVSSNASGELQVNLSPQDLKKFKTRGWVTYGDFGALGDGKTDDIEAIAATHAVANQNALPVKADEGKTYYIS